MDKIMADLTSAEDFQVAREKRELTIQAGRLAEQVQNILSEFGRCLGREEVGLLLQQLFTQCKIEKSVFCGYAEITIGELEKWAVGDIPLNISCHTILHIILGSLTPVLAQPVSISEGPARNGQHPGHPAEISIFPRGTA
jgi:hypothetical protein